MSQDKTAAIAELHTKREGLRADASKLVDEARGASRELTEDETKRFDAAEADVRAIDAQIAKLDEQIRADAAHDEVMKRYASATPSGFRVTSEPETYQRGNGKSFFRDLYRAKQGDFEAASRLQRNNAEQAEKRAGGLTTTNGAGGEMVPPLWLVDDFVRYARAGRVTANLVRTLPLPPGTDSINIPKILTGTATAPMTGQNTGINETDLTTTSVSSSVYTIAGGQTVSLQLLEQSPINIDDAVLQDLAAAYAVSLNSGILTGTGSAGTPVGITSLSGTNAITYTSASPTVAALYSAVANAVQQVHTNRFMPADTIVMHPRRWAYLLAASDTTNRPLVLPSTNSPMNVAASQQEVAAQGYVGQMQGLPVFVDPLIPTNVGTGTNQDTIIVGRFADLVLWESDIRAESFVQTYAQNMSVFLRLYNYASFQAGRYPQSLSIINGTGLVAPTF
jgi:HK97 family phage major capsid protein